MFRVFSTSTKNALKWHPVDQRVLFHLPLLVYLILWHPRRFSCITLYIEFIGFAAFVLWKSFLIPSWNKACPCNSCVVLCSVVLFYFCLVLFCCVVSAKLCMSGFAWCFLENLHHIMWQRELVASMTWGTFAIKANFVVKQRNRKTPTTRKTLHKIL